MFERELIRKSLPIPFGASLLAPIVVTLVIAASAVVLFIMWSSAHLDRLSTERQTSIAAASLDTVRSNLARLQISVVQAASGQGNLRPVVDSAWALEHLARPLLFNFGHDAVAVLDDNDRQLFAASRSGEVEPAALNSLVSGLTPLLARVRSRTKQGSSPYQALTDYLVIDGRPVLASVIPLASLEAAEGIGLLHVVIEDLDDELARHLGKGGMLEEPTFTTMRGEDPARAVFPLIDGNGRFVAFLEWSVFRPGRLIVQTTGPAIGAAVMLATLMVVVLIDQLWRHSSALESSRAAAQRQATHDPLTDLYNRTHFDEVLGRTLAGGGWREGLSLLMLDLDRFKHVNDTLGHEAGDELLRCVSHRLRALVSSQDVIARLGGDEFGIIRMAGDTQAVLAYALSPDGLLS
ncbi:MAG: diguanylate cyclase, partial [Devosia sp.]